MKIVLFGGKGYLGQSFLSAYPDAITPSVDIADQETVSKVLDDVKPDVVINAAGKTGRPNIDWCEDHRMETVRSNVTGPLVLLEECAKRSIYWVHMSSGCIFEGDNGGKGFAEEDEPNFMGSFYSRTKIWSDQILREFPVLILRLRMPFDNTLHERSLITKLLKYRRVLDVQNSLTYLPDFLRVSQKLIEQRKTGIYHMVNPGPVSPYRIMQWYREMVDPAHEVERLTVAQLPQVTKAGRSNCVLSIRKVEREGLQLLSGEEAVKAALHSIRSHK